MRNRVVCVLSDTIKQKSFFVSFVLYNCMLLILLQIYHVIAMSLILLYIISISNSVVSLSSESKKTL